MINTELNDFSISQKKLKIDVDNILFSLGYKDLKKIDKNIIDKTNFHIKKCMDICSPRGCYTIQKIINIDKKNHNLKINKFILSIGRIITAQLNNSEYLALFICTAGDAIEKYSKVLMDSKEYLDGYIVDLIGSEIAEAAANFIHGEIKKYAGSLKLNITNRFSPGYCTWNVIEQFKLFEFFPDNSCGITLTNGGLMSPIKSVSGIVGIGKDVSFKNYSCEICNFKECQLRFIKNKKKI